MKFSNLSGADVSAKARAIFKFYGLPGEPWLAVFPGGEINKPYFNQVLMAQTKNRKRLTAGRIDPEMLQKNRQLDRKLYPLHMDAGAWGGWVDDETGQPVPYSVQGFAELIQQLPNYLFDELRAFCNEVTNFTEPDEPDEEDIDETVGN